jgi:hypothetical protein
LFFKKIEEEGSAARLHHLPKLLAETAVFSSASGLGCGLVVGFTQGSSESSVLQSTFSGCWLVKSFYTGYKFYQKREKGSFGCLVAAMGVFLEQAAPRWL